MQETRRKVDRRRVGIGARGLSVLRFGFGFADRYRSGVSVWNVAVFFQKLCGCFRAADSFDEHVPPQESCLQRHHTEKTWTGEREFVHTSYLPTKCSLIGVSCNRCYSVSVMSTPKPKAVISVVDSPGCVEYSLDVDFKSAGPTSKPTTAAYFSVHILLLVFAHVKTFKYIVFFLYRNLTKNPSQKSSQQQSR